MNKRIAWVDNAKSIGVLLVIIGHFLGFTNFNIINNIIYSFHVPLFFILSGYVYKLKPKISIIKKFKKLIIPAYLYIYIYIAFRFIFDKNYIDSFEKFLKNNTYILGRINGNTPTWYFICLFEIYVFQYIINKLFGDKANKCIGILAIVFTFYCYINKIQINYLGTNKMIFGYFYFVFGTLFVKNEKIENKKLIIITLFFLFFSILNGKCTFYGFVFNNILIYTIASILGSIIVIEISKRINISNLNFLSSNSIFIICSHKFFIFGYELLNNLFTINIFINDILCIIVVVLIILFYKYISEQYGRFYENRRIR